jgi:hypothetical protein
MKEYRFFSRVEQQVTVRGGKLMVMRTALQVAPALASVLLGIAFYVDTARVEAAEAEQTGEQPKLGIEHSECSFFGPLRERYMAAVLGKVRAGRGESQIGRLTRAVASRLPQSQSGGAHGLRRSTAGIDADSIDAYVLADLADRGITPAEPTNDFEFIRRVTVDLTGRIPGPEQVIQLVNDPSPSKRAALIDSLLASSEWVDKWTVFFSDLFKNTYTNTQITIFNEGRNAFYKWIHDSLANHKPYNQMATELIAATGTSNIDQTQGQLNFLILNNQGGGPVQDVYDSQAAGVAEAFLGMAHMNCLLCHNGRGHLEGLSLWGSTFTRCQAWQFSSFISHTAMPRFFTPDDPNIARANNGLQYRALVNSTVSDYTLNTTIGNRPARALGAGACAAATVAPVYIDGTSTAVKGSDYRAALAKYITGDMQFSRAAVNYVWAHLFGVGIVDPPDQFDLARLDPDNPPPAQWTLQPSNPQLLDALARHFILNRYDIKALLREIANSQSYQLSSRYSGDWDPAWEPYFARHFVRRLWAEELHDAVVIASGIIPKYNVPNFSDASTVYQLDSPGFGLVSFAMQLPDVRNEPDGAAGPVSLFLDAFQRGDRDMTPRKGEGSIQQALNLMSDNFVVSRTHATGTGIAGSNLVAALNAGLSDSQLVTQLYLTVLSRYPSDDELQIATGNLSANPNHTQAAEDLFWVLFNKVDFIFNY